MKKRKEGLDVSGIAMQLSGRFGLGLDALRRLDGYNRSNHQCSGKRRWTVTTRVAKTPERSAGQIHRCDNPLGHKSIKALRGM